MKHSIDTETVDARSAKMGSVSRALAGVRDFWRGWTQRSLELHDSLSVPMQGLIAVLVYAAAVATRLVILPVDGGYAFLTFYPAIVVSFYLCGRRAGWITVFLAAITCYFIFIPPYWSFAITAQGVLQIGVFLVSCTMIGLVMSQLHANADRMKRLMAALELSEIRHKGVLEDQSEFICRALADGTILFANEAFCRLFGQSKDALIGRNWHPVAWHEDIPFIEAKLATLTPDNPIVVIENRIIAAGGKIRWGQFVNRGFFDEAGNLREIQSVGRDVTERKALETELHRVNAWQKAILDNDLVGIATIKNRKIVWKNAAFEVMFGYSSEELIGMETKTFYKDIAYYDEIGAAAYPVLFEREIYKAQLKLVKKDGGEIWVDSNGVMLDGPHGEFLWIVVDITASKMREEEIAHFAFHDSLTGLPNRLLLSDRVEQALGQAKRLDKLMAVCYLDLDDFKPVNDIHGHEAGDELLKETASRILNSVRANDTVCRLGGDEFVILLTDMDNAEEYHAIIQRMINAINMPFHLQNGSAVRVSASIGVTLYPLDQGDAESLLRHADQAMYQAKRLGRNRVHPHRFGARAQPAAYTPLAGGGGSGERLFRAEKIILP